ADVDTFTATTRPPAIGVPPESVTYPRILPVLVCDTAAGAAIATRVRPSNSRRPSCANDVRLMSPSPVHVFASLITRTLGFVKVGEGRIDWGRRLPIFLFSDTGSRCAPIL